MTNKDRDFYFNAGTNQFELKSNPSPLRPWEEERTEPKVGSPAHRKKFPLWTYEESGYDEYQKNN